MIWTLDQDDYTGLFCRQGPFPLTQKIHELLTSDHSKEREASNSTKPHTKPIGSLTSTTHRRTSTSRKPTSTSTISSSKSKNVGTHTQNNSSLYLLVFILFLL